MSSNISYVGQAQAASSSVTLPGGIAKGDLILIFAYRNTTTAPSLPAGYTSIFTQSANGNSMRVGYKFAVGSDTSGTWTNANIVQAVVYRGVRKIGGAGSTTNASASTVTVAGIGTMTDTSGNSWVVTVAGTLQTTSMNNVPSGTTQRGTTQAGTSCMALISDTNGGVSSWAQTTPSIGASAAGAGGSIELVSNGGDITNLTDAFSGNSLDTTKWSQTTTGSATMSYASGGGQVNYPSSSTSATEGLIQSVTSYNLVGKSAYLAYLTIPSSSTGADASFYLCDDPATLNNFVGWQTESGNLYAQYQVAGTQTNGWNTVFDSVNHKYLRVRESAGTTYWDTSPDAVTWTNRFSIANPIVEANLYVFISGSCYQNETNPGTFKFNNFNTTGSTIASTTITTKSRIQKAITTTIASVTRIQKTVSTTIASISRIQKSVSTTIASISRITAKATKTITTVTRITGSRNTTIASVSRVQKSFTTTLATISRIQKNLTTTISSIANIKNSVTKTIATVSRIQKSVNTTITSISRVSLGVTKIITFVSRIQKSLTTTITSVANIRNAVTKTIATVSRIQKSFSTTIATISRITHSENTTITLKSRITAAITKTITLLSRITNSRTTTINTVSRIKNTFSVTLASVSNISKSVTKTIASISRLASSKTKTITTISRIKLVRSTSIPVSFHISPPVEFKIINNVIVDADRQSWIGGIYNSLAGIAYYPFTADTVGLGYFEVGDRIIISDQNNKQYGVVIMGIELTIQGGIQETISAAVPASTNTDYSSAGIISKIIKNTQIIVNKQQGEIDIINETITNTLTTKDDVTAAITLANASIISSVQDITTALNATNGHVDANTSNISTIQTSLTSLVQTASDLSLKVSKAGGVNLLKNSVGLKGSIEEWQVFNPDGSLADANNNATIVQNADVLANSESGSSLQITNQYVVQTVPTISGQLYTLYLRFKKTGTCTISITGIPNQSLTVPSYSDGTWAIFKYQFTATNAYTTIKFATTGTDVATLADIMFKAGDASGWQPAPNEVYGKNYRFDKDGFELTDPNSNFKAILNNTSLTVYDTSSGTDKIVMEVSNANGIITDLVAQDQLVIQRYNNPASSMRIIPTSNGAYIVINN